MGREKQSLAIIGTGIAGMGAAHLLQKDYNIQLFEKNDYVGGHTNTVYVEEEHKQIPIDTGFMVFNKNTYPHLLQLFSELNVPIEKTNMSFSVQHKASGLEYCGSGLGGLFAQKLNLFRPAFYRMLFQINRFNKESIEDLEAGKLEGLSLQDYINRKGFGQNFTDKYIIPMSSAIWSTPPDISLQFPAKSLVRFFLNHGMLGLDTHFQWYTIKNGSESYKQSLIAPFRERIHLNTGIKNIREVENGVELITINNIIHRFDRVIVAAHADEALRILDNPSNLQKELLSLFTYQKNIAVLHKDTGVMPQKRKVWSSWNYIMDDRSENTQSSTIYHMNSLQKLNTEQDYFVSINPIELEEKSILKTIQYDHPIFTIKAMEKQHRLPELNHEGRIHFCGSYFRYGFHEDAYSSAVHLAQELIQLQTPNPYSYKTISKNGSNS